MLILTIRTDKPDAEVGLYNDKDQLAYETWQAHRELAETIHLKIDTLLKSQQKDLHDLQAVAVFKGPGSFTGLRIGLSVANALAQGLGLPIVAESGDEWKAVAIIRLLGRENEQLSLPEYGAPPHITPHKK